MKKLLFLFSIAAVLTVPSLAIDRHILWSRIWGSTSSDYGYGVSVDSAGNIYVCGRTRGSFDGQSNPSAGSTYSLCLTKYNSSGSSIWTRIWGSTGYDSGKGVSVDSAGNVYVCGETRGSFDGQSNPGGYSLCLTKYDSSGNKKWTRIWGSTSTDDGNGVSVDSAGNVYICGLTRGSFDGQSNPCGGTGTNALCLTKYDSSGNKQWTRIWGSSTYDGGYGVSVDSTGNVYVCGYTYGSFDGQSNPGGYSLCLTKYDSSGTKQWTRIWGSTSTDGGNGVSVDSAGNVYICGLTRGSFDGQSNPCGGTGTNALCLTKYDGSGIKQWTRIWGSIDRDEGNGVSVDSAGNVYVCGQTEGSFDGQSNPCGGTGTNALCLTKYDSSGTKQWTRIWGSTSYDSGNGISVNQFRHIYVCGATGGSFDGQSNPGGGSLCLTKFFAPVALVKPIYAWRTNALTLCLDVYYAETLIDSAKEFLSTNSGASWFYYTNSVTFPSEGTYFWTARARDYSNNLYYAEQTNKLIITTTLPEIDLIEPGNGTVLTNIFDAKLTVDFGSSSFSRQLSTNNGATWFDYEAGASVVFPNTGVWHWTARGQNAAGRAYASETNSIEIIKTSAESHSIHLVEPYNGQLFLESNINFKVLIFDNFDYTTMSTNHGGNFFNANFPLEMTMPLGTNNWTARGTYDVPVTTDIYADRTNKFEVLAYDAPAQVRLLEPKNDDQRLVHFVNFDALLYKTHDLELSTNGGTSFFEYEPTTYFQSTGIVYWTCRAKDVSNNWVYAGATNRLELVTIIDRSPPVANYILLNGGDDYASNANVEVSLSATDANLTDMIISENSDFSGATWQEYSTATNWHFGGGDGTKTLYAKFKDVVGNESSVVSSNIIIDTGLPTVSSIAFSADPMKAGVLTASVAFADAPAGMNTSVSPSVNFVAANARTGNFSQIDFIGNNWRGHCAVVSGDDGVAYVNVLNGADKAGNVMLAALNITNFLIDTTAPTNLSVQINGGAAYSANHDVTLTLNAEDVLAVEMMIANDAGFSGASWENFAASKSWTLANGDGARSVFVKFRDALGNESAAVNDNITVDTAAPTNPQIVINSGEEFITDLNVVLHLSATDANLTEMRIANNSFFAGAPWQDYSATTNWQFSGGDGVKTIYAQFRDGIGNESAAAQTSVIYDTTSPTVSSAGAAVSPSKSGIITVSVAFAESGVGMDNSVSPSVYFRTAGGANRYVSELDFTGNNWLGHGYINPGDDGTATIQVSGAKDKAGNTMTANNNAGSFLIDTLPPTNYLFEINFGAEFTSNALVTITNFAIGADFIDLSISQDFSVVQSTNYVDCIQHFLSNENGTNYIFARYRDLAGNSTETNDSIILDTVAPVAASILINNGDAETENTNVVLTLSADDLYLSEMRVSDKANFSGATWRSYTGNLNWNLPLPIGEEKTVYAQFRDAAGWESEIAQDSILLVPEPTGIIGLLLLILIRNKRHKCTN